MTNEAEPTTYLPDPANDETLTMTGYEWWRYRRAIEAEARAESAAKVRALREAVEGNFAKRARLWQATKTAEQSIDMLQWAWNEEEDALAAPAPSEPWVDEPYHGEGCYDRLASAPLAAPAPSEPGLDPETLANAYNNVTRARRMWFGIRMDVWDDIAAEYARLRGGKE